MVEKRGYVFSSLDYNLKRNLVIRIAQIRTPLVLNKYTCYVLLRHLWT